MIRFFSFKLPSFQTLNDSGFLRAIIAPTRF
jgi:hypothetical protein